MNITAAAPASVRQRKAQNRPRHDWSPLMTALAAQPGIWLSIPLRDLPDAIMKRNQASVASVAMNRIGRIQTQTEGDTLFVRLVIPNGKTK